MMLTKSSLVLSLFIFRLSADTLHNNQLIQLTEPTPGRAKTTLSTLIKNETAAQRTYPFETKDLQTLRVLDRKVGIGTRIYQFNSNKSADLGLASTKLTAKSAEVNLKSGEETGIVAHSDQITY